MPQNSHLPLRKREQEKQGEVETIVLMEIKKVNTKPVMSPQGKTLHSLEDKAKEEIKFRWPGLAFPLQHLNSLLYLRSLLLLHPEVLSIR